MLGILLFSACEQEDILPELGTTFDLKVGERADIQSNPISVRLVTISEDSRCPADGKILCISAGSVTADFAVWNDDLLLGEPKLTINGPSTNVQEENVTTVAGYKITLISVNPYPETIDPIPQEDYVVSLQISRE